MNFLAHLYLAGPDPEARVGNLMGDFLKGVDLATLSPAVREGVRLHCRIDAYTDEHPVVRGAKRLVSATHSRYAGVLVDVFFDHFLARGWAEYSSESLDGFVAGVYAELLDRHAALPERMQRSVTAMVEQDWLMSYRSLTGIEMALTRASHRLRRPHPLGDAVADLEARREEFEGAFRAFFPELEQFVRSTRTTV